MSDICYESALNQLSLIKTKKISCMELLGLHLDKLEKINPKVNAITTKLYDEAIISAKDSDERISNGENIRSLEGLPTAIKDLHMTRGVVTTEGSRIYKNRIPDYDSLIVSRIKQAGVTMLGKSNTPEFGAGSQTFNELFGPTLNPYDLTKTCGGSSGGSAVALACGIVSIATGSDLGGSLRNPAAWNNVVGFRPTLGLVPSFSKIPWNTLSTDGPMGRTVEDIVLQMKVISGNDKYIPSNINMNLGFNLEEFFRKKQTKLKIAWGGNLGNRPINKEVLDITKDSMKEFMDIGVEIFEDFPDLSESDEIFNSFRAYKFAIDHEDHLNSYPTLVKKTIKWNTNKGIKMKALHLAKMEQLRAEIWKRMIKFFENYDFLALPVTSVPPFSVDIEYPKKINNIELKTYLDWMWPCYVISVTGMPAISVPCGFTKNGLPVGLQLIGSHLKDIDLLSIAYAFQEVTNCYKKTPKICIENLNS